MTPKEALEYLVQQLQNKASCGRLSEKEREAIKVLKDSVNEQE